MPRRCGRLRRASEFERVRVEGQSWAAPLLTLRAAPAPGETIRSGTITSRRMGTAVQRNRVRRLVREALRRVCPRIRGGWDLVVVPRPTMVRASADQVQMELEHLLRQAGLLEGPPKDRTSDGGFAV